MPTDIAVHPPQLTAERRTRLAEIYPNERLVVPTGVETVRTNDGLYPFRPGTDHVWLTGNTVIGSVLVIDTAGGADGSTPFVRPGSGRTGDEFWRDAAIGDLWVGRRPSLRELSDALGIDCKSLDDMPAAIRGDIPTRVVPTLDGSVDRLVRDARGDDFMVHLQLKTTLDHLRLVKDDWELDQMRAAATAAVRGFEDCVREWDQARIWGERYVEGTFSRRSRIEGEGPAYSPIVASGQHAATLHWIENSGPLGDRDLILLDMGVELRSLYSSDVTRTLPVSGRYTALQKNVYEIVLGAQRAGIDTLRPGVRFQDYQDACSRSLASGLIDLGLLSCSVDEAMEADTQYFRRWSISRSGHMLGMDVHDCNHAPVEAYLTGELSAGNVLTVEPGLYFQPEDETVPAELRGMGIRIEDDLIVTPTGSENLTDELPREPEGVEAWMSDLLGQSPSARSGSAS